MNPFRTRFLRCNPVLAGAVAAAFGAVGAASAALTFTDTTNITVANTQIEVGPDTSENPDVTGGAGGPLLSYAEIGTNAYGCCGPNYGSQNLNDGDIGIGVPSSGLYAIADAAGPPVVLGFGGTATVTGIAIYNGYQNRDDGDYILRDGAGTMQGAWTVLTTGGGSNDGVDSMWLTFDTPLSTDRLSIEYSVGDCCGTPSFREIQVFGVPEPTAGALLVVALAGCTISATRRRRHPLV